MGKPAVFQATVTPDEILCVVNDRGEREFIVRPDKPVRLNMTAVEMEERAATWADDIRKYNAAVMKRITTN